jgi:multiple sugar transport system ATP-binding protein
MVFQGYALYPQMTARQIMEFPLRMRKVPASERSRAVDEAAAMLGLSRLLDRRPDQLSGGERQRVAMGRAIVRRPRVFLFDEPLSNVDPSLRSELRTEIGILVRRLGATALYVTHDHVEAMTLADRIAVMREGRLLQCAAPREIYERPATEFVGSFVGTPRMNVLDATVDASGSLHAGPFRLPKLDGVESTVVRVGIRPEDVHLDGSDGVKGEIAAIEPLGAETHLVVAVGELRLRARHAGFDLYSRGETVTVRLDAARAHYFDPAREGARVEARS